MKRILSHKKSVRDHGISTQTITVCAQIRGVCCALMITFLSAGCSTVDVGTLFQRETAPRLENPQPLYRGQSPGTRRQRQLEALINHELAGTSVEERRRWLRELSHLDLETARSVLRERRTTLSRQSADRIRKRTRQKQSGQLPPSRIRQVAASDADVKMPLFSNGNFGHSGLRPPGNTNQRRVSNQPPYPPGRNRSASQQPRIDADSGLPLYQRSGNNTPRTLNGNNRAPSVAGPGLDGPPPVISPGVSQYVAPTNRPPRSAPTNRNKSTNSGAVERAEPLLSNPYPPANDQSRSLTQTDIREIPQANIPPGYSGVGYFVFASTSNSAAGRYRQSV